MNRLTLLALAGFTTFVLAGCPLPGNGDPNDPGNGNGDMNGNNGEDDTTDEIIRLSPDFNDAEREGTTESGATADTTCDGFFEDARNNVLILDEPITNMTIAAVSVDDADLTLRVVFGDSVFCGDASDPTVTRGNWSAGEYDIFIGTADPNTTAAYRLVFTEN